MKPSWDEAPSWANWLAMDGDGEWFWFQNKPFFKDEVWMEYSEKGLVEEASDEPDESGIDWDFAYDTLESRPCSPPPSP